MQMGLVAAAVSYPDVPLSLKDGPTADAEISDICWLSDQIEIPYDLDFYLTEADENLVYYTSGCIGRSVGRIRKCTSCKDLLIECDGEDQSSLTAEISVLFGSADETAKTASKFS